MTIEKVVIARENLKEARTRQKSYVDKHRRAVEFQTGERVFQKVSPARGVRRFGIKGKLSPRFIGPFEILDRVGEVSYRLALPPQLSHVHNVFHISLFRGYKYHLLHVVSIPSIIFERIYLMSRSQRLSSVVRTESCGIKSFLSSRSYGGTILSGKPLGRRISLSELLIFISLHDPVCFSFSRVTFLIRG